MAGLPSPSLSDASLLGGAAGKRQGDFHEGQPPGFRWESDTGLYPSQNTLSLARDLQLILSEILSSYFRKDQCISILLSSHSYSAPA